MLRKPTGENGLSCVGCPLYRNGFGFSALEGDGNLMVIAESLGRAEEREGLPLRPHAPSGGVFQRALDVAGLKRSTMTLTNTIRCKSEAPHPRAAIDHCRQYLDATVTERQPRLLLALGDVPLRELSLLGGSVSISEVRGYVLPSRYGIPMIATYHPSYLARGAFGQLFGVFLHDVRTAYKFAREGVPAKIETHYILQPTDTDKRDYLNKIRADTSLPIAHDVETEDILGVKGPADWRHKTIIQVQFSSGIGEAIVVPFPDDREFVQAVYATPNMKWGWNSRLSDTLALRGSGITINGENHDLMNAHLHLQPGFASGKDAADDEDKGVPAKLANLQACVSFYYPQECLSAKTHVRLADGSRMRIKEIVERRLPVTLWGMSDSGKRIPVNVIDWHKTKTPSLKWKKGQRWICIRPTARTQSIYCTPDHMIWTKRGWQKADKLQVGDYIKTWQIGSEDLIHGTIMGDGHVTSSGQLKISHSHKQQEWLTLKARHLGVKAKFQSRPPRKIGGQIGDAYYLSTAIGIDWRDKFYFNNNRIFVEPPSMAALAVWYCDDGHWKKYNGRWVQGDGTATIAIDYMRPKLEKVKEYFVKNFGNNVRLVGVHFSHCQLHMGRETRNRFYEAISPFVPDCMSYKLPPRWRGRYNGWLSQQVPRWIKVDHVDRDFRNYAMLGSSKDRYCVTVDHPTHRFFVDGGLVANCPWKGMVEQVITKVRNECTELISTTKEDKERILLERVRHDPEILHTLRWYGARDSDLTYRVGVKIFASLRKLGLW